MIRLQPLHQRATGVQRDPQVFVRLENIEERQIAILISLFKYAVKVSDWLVVMKYKTKMDEGLFHLAFGFRSCRRG